ncbi:hypothetical protein [Ramlibacter rhizophilus]|uniref:Uncharacterized protein n=1 Tax=Ramlibacter rhizophilus TaxID=1781167 RepID=A0A4Z0BVF2_9BURK|nr:hypothetical protein [Ramlibacter rhizophilus]TFZ03297.1 hypothetical protein EZ242_05255 [Ramlibacter rhizophilus]
MKLLSNSPSIRAGLILIGIALASVAQPALGRPFKGSLDLEERIGRMSRCPGAQGQPGTGGTLNGTGHATHLGAVQLYGSHCISSEPGTPPAAFTVYDGQMAMRAANGDVVMADYSGVFSLVVTGSYTFEGQYVVTGGTGRFQNASGTGRLYGALQGDVPSFQQAVSMDAQGEIDY